MCADSGDHFEDCSSLKTGHTHWSSFITTTCPPLNSVPHALPPLHPSTHTPAWTTQTFGGQLRHSCLHNGAFVTPSSTPVSTSKQWHTEERRHTHGAK